MNGYIKVISLLILAGCFAVADTQDSSHAQNGTLQPSATSTPSDPSASSVPPEAAPGSQNAENIQNSAEKENVNTNIVVNQGQPAQNTKTDEHLKDTKNSDQPPQTTGHEYEEHHEEEQHHDDKGMTHQLIHKLLQQMTEQQLDAFQKSLQGQALEHYNKLMAEEEQQEHQEQVQYEEQYEQIKGELTKTEIEQEKQQEQYEKEQEKFKNQLLNYNEYLFELDGENTEDFRFAIAASQQIVFHGYTYENVDGVYSATADIQEQQPIWLYVYQNSHKLVFQKSFYFKYAGSFLGTQNCTYLFRFVNPSEDRLIGINIGFLFETGHVHDKLTSHDIANHSRRIQIFKHDISNHYTDMAMKSMLENQNRENLLSKLNHYYTYSIVQLVILLVLCLLQVEFVKKLLSNNNIV